MAAKVREVRAIFERDVVRCAHGVGCKNCCWGWKGGTKKGKGQISVKKQQWSASSVAWRLYHNRRPEKNLMNLCENGVCTNPLHWDTHLSDEAIHDRFWSRVQRCEHTWDCDLCCWPWIAGTSSDGYGSFLYKGRQLNASRVAWILHWNKGVCPDSKIETRHSCHNPPCCNPNHLSLGSHAENMRDRSEAGRSFRKLSDQNNLDIRALYATGRYSETQLGERFSVSVATISRVLARNIFMPEDDGVQPAIDAQLAKSVTRIREGRKYTVTPEQVKHMRDLYAKGNHTQEQLAAHYGISRKQVNTILRGLQWRDVDGPLIAGATESKGEGNNQAKLTEDKVQEIRQLAKTGKSQYAIAKKFQVSQSTIGKILTGRTWAHVL